MGVVRALLSAVRQPVLSCLLVALPAVLAAQTPLKAVPSAGAVTLGVGGFTSETDGSVEAGEFGGDALATFVETELSMLLQDGAEFAWCPGHLINIRRKQDILNEQAFQQSKYVDPKTAIPKSEMGVPDPDLLIEGGVVTVGGEARWRVHLRGKTGGPDVFSHEGRDPYDTLSDVAHRLARNILDQSCPRPYDVTGGGPRIEVTGTIVRLDEPFELRGKFPGGSVIFAYEPTSHAGGTVRYVLTGGGFTGSGSGTYTVTDPGDGGVLIMLQDTKGCIVGIPNSCKANNEKLTLTPIYSR